MRSWVRHFASRSGLQALTVCLLLASSKEGSTDSTHCFEADEKPSVPIMMQAPPPPASAKSYPYHPASLFVTMNVNAILMTETAKPLYFFQWANHGPRRVQKGNLGPDVSQASATKLHFSSIATANACTLVQTATLLPLSLEN